MDPHSEPICKTYMPVTLVSIAHSLLQNEFLIPLASCTEVNSGRSAALSPAKATQLTSCLTTFLPSWHFLHAVEEFAIIHEAAGARELVADPRPARAVVPHLVALAL